MLRLLKLVAVLGIFAAIVVVGFAYLGDLSPDRQDVVEPVNLDAL